MKKRLFVALMALVMVCSCLPAASLAAAKQMRDGIPVWNEESVKEYALSLVKGEDLDRLWGYYDLQVRRYMPMDTYEALLPEIEWMTGDFIEFGTYTSFEEPELKSKTHVLHLCMEKQDLDLYFTHKNKEDDWEVMAVEFALADKQAMSDGRDMLVTGDGAADTDVTLTNPPAYTETEVTLGAAPYELKGTLTLPEGAGPENKAPACVLVQGSGPSDRDETIGGTRFFADLAHAFAEKGIATLRYDKRTFTYGAAMPPEEIKNLSVEEETIQDAIFAGKLLQGNENVDPKRIILAGHSMGAMLAPRIATEANGLFAGLLMIAGTPKTLLEIMVSQNQDVISKMKDEEQQKAAQAQLVSFQEQVKSLGKMTEAEARELTIAGVNGYYFWEMAQYDSVKLMKKLKIPMYIVQGNADFQISVANGVEAYEDALGEDVRNIDYKTFRGLNHMLMKFTGNVEDKGTLKEYDTPATLDTMAARDLAAWVNSVGAPQPEEESE